MSRWFNNLKDGDRVALILIGIGLTFVLIGSMATFGAILFVKEDARIDRSIVALAVLGSQGGGLITAGMGVLKLRDNGTSQTTPPAGDGKG